MLSLVDHRLLQYGVENFWKLRDYQIFTKISAIFLALTSIATFWRAMAFSTSLYISVLWIPRPQKMLNACKRVMHFRKMEHLIIFNYKTYQRHLHQEGKHENAPNSQTRRKSARAV